MVVLLWCIRHSSEHPEDSSLLFRLLDLGIGRTDFSVCCRWNHCTTCAIFLMFLAAIRMRIWKLKHIPRGVDGFLFHSKWTTLALVVFQSPRWIQAATGTGSSWTCLGSPEKIWCRFPHTYTEVECSSVIKARSENSALNVNYRPHPSHEEYQKRRFF